MNIYPFKSRRRAWIVKPHRFVLSRGDAANFTVHPKYKEKGRKIRAIDSKARLFHYWWVKSEKGLKAKYANAQRFADEKKYKKALDIYTFPQKFLSRYHGSHPRVMEERIRNHTLWLDWESPMWRNKLTWNEKKLLFKTWIVENLTHRYHGCHSIKFVNNLCTKYRPVRGRRTS